MNTFYTWTKDEIMVTEQMKDIQRDVDSYRMIRDAGLSKPGLYERAAIAFGSTLVKLGERLQKKYTHSHQAYQAASGKYAV